MTKMDMIAVLNLLGSGFICYLFVFLLIK
jgi:hypothetical protein